MPPSCSRLFRKRYSISNVFDALVALRCDVADGAKTNGDALVFKRPTKRAVAVFVVRDQAPNVHVVHEQMFNPDVDLSSTHESRPNTRRAVCISPHNSIKPQVRHICADAGTSLENSENNGLSLSRKAIGSGP